MSMALPLRQECRLGSVHSAVQLGLEPEPETPEEPEQKPEPEPDPDLAEPAFEPEGDGVPAARPEAGFPAGNAD